MSSGRIELAVIVGSVRPQRLGPSVAQWFVDVAGQRAEFSVSLLDLLELELQSDLSPSAGAERLAETISSAAAVVVVTPEYNHGYPASVKTALDTLKYEWRGKPIGFVSYGGMFGGARAVEQLRSVATELHMVTVRDSVGFARARKVFGGNRIPETGPELDSANRMLDQLWWWASAAAARGAVDPYPHS
ncbi:MAG: NAD(P)H-dependent oxidoreductase [Rhodococcus fascians]|uniref:NADPH-dependent FMN reductase n=1 Tax=Nocardiaceae TaxID=85025 RepID=UPI000375E642|nr:MULTISPECIES: NAD(P)H-dependent oxidoreductase [Rhodococcus]OZC55806.1 NADPH-dependent oxidoreductase [Rhodococcus sp. 06-621-2]OZC92750.1 NADPH-dependent oxidoreductase [Rhodococcus sp. 06-418-1B]OZD07680.1 NADPH-dependent oxidoreductase [Rhodococcus sp. 06-156-4C]OZD17108.1 NADPH-dependent oxidoreductase [Rhodococcus sp. 06-156-3C]OZD18446.1 NADPH-dependent oxidoreductase [Rhodococcus sp. 06-156-4a]